MAILAKEFKEMNHKWKKDKFIKEIMNFNPNLILKIGESELVSFVRCIRKGGLVVWWKPSLQENNNKQLNCLLNRLIKITLTGNLT